MGDRSFKHIIYLKGGFYVPYCLFVPARGAARDIQF